VTPGVFPALLRSLSAAGIRHVLLRDHPEAPGIRDLDLLIDRARLADVVRLAGEIGFEEVPPRRLNPGKRVLRLDREGDVYIIDLHERLIHRGVEYLDADLVLSRSRPVPCSRGREGHSVPSLEDELLTLLMHNVVGKGAVQPKHLARLRWLLAQPLDEPYIATHLDRFGIADVVNDARGDFEALAADPALVEECRRRLLRRLERHRVANLVRATLVRMDAVRRTWFGGRRGAVVAFVGPDGCGKSSITTALREEFRRSGVPTEIVYLGPWGQHKLPLHGLVRRFNLRPYLPKGAGGDDARVRRGGVARRWFDTVKGTVFFLLLAVELWFRYIRLVLPRLLRGRLVLADRYIYDIMIGYKNRRLISHERLRSWLCRLYPRPDVTILLDAAPEVIHARKAQFDVDALGHIRLAYHGLREAFDLHPLDTSVSVQITMDDFRRTLLPLVLKALRP
jgi:thymidylate kinase